MPSNKEFSYLYKLAYLFPEEYLSFIKKADSTESMLRHMENLAKHEPRVKSYVSILNDNPYDAKVIDQVTRVIEHYLKEKESTALKEVVPAFIKKLVESARRKMSKKAFNENMRILHSSLSGEFSKKKASPTFKYADVFSLLATKDINEHLRLKYASVISVKVTCDYYTHEDAEYGERSFSELENQSEETYFETCQNLDELDQILADLARKYQGWTKVDSTIKAGKVFVTLQDPEPEEWHSVNCTILITCPKEMCSEISTLVQRRF